MKVFGLPAVLLVCWVFVSPCFAQIPVPGADEAIKSASQSGWTSVLVCIIVLASLAGVAWLFKQMSGDKNRLADSLDKLNTFVQTTLADLHGKTEAACIRSAQALESHARSIDGLTAALNHRGLDAPPVLNSRTRKKPV